MRNEDITQELLTQVLEEAKSNYLSRYGLTARSVNSSNLDTDYTYYLELSLSRNDALEIKNTLANLIGTTSDVGLVITLST